MTFLGRKSVKNGQLYHFSNVRKSLEKQASKKFYNKCSENSRSQIVFRTDIFRKLTLGAPVKTHLCYIVMYFVFKRVINRFIILSCLLLFRQRFSSSHQKMLSFWYPGYPEVFLACGGNLPCRPKAEATSGGATRKKTLFARGTMNEDMTETGNRARKVSGKPRIILVLVK